MAKWVKIKDGGREYLNIDTGAILRHTCELEDWYWIPAIEHEINGTKRIIFIFDGIKERESAWYGTTQDRDAAIQIAISELEKFVKSLEEKEAGNG